jgi:hypothetical protein
MGARMPVPGHFGIMLNFNHERCTTRGVLHWMQLVYNLQVVFP